MTQDRPPARRARPAIRAAFCTPWWSSPSSAMTLTSTLAHASWVHNGVGLGSARAVLAGAGSSPTPTTSGRNVSLTWATSTYSNGVTVPSYLVKRYDAAGTVVQTMTSGTCAALVTGLTCTESAVPTGSWRYSVTPAVGNWRGAESAKVGRDRRCPVALADSRAGPCHRHALGERGQLRHRAVPDLPPRQRRQRDRPGRHSRRRGHADLRRRDGRRHRDGHPARRHHGRRAHRLRRHRQRRERRAGHHRGQHPAACADDHVGPDRQRGCDNSDLHLHRHRARRDVHLHDRRRRRDDVHHRCGLPRSRRRVAHLLGQGRRRCRQHQCGRHPDLDGGHDRAGQRDHVPGRRLLLHVGRVHSGLLHRRHQRPVRHRK